MKININLSNLYSTSDLALATALSLWYQVESLVKLENSNRIEFVFKRDKELDELVEQYWKGELSIEPQKYFQQLKILKTRIHSQ